MIACSAELVLATHKTVTMTFPAVLEPAGITAFDLSKVIEYFVRHEDTLPRELKRHLNSIEERLLESMAWEKGSSMYTSLIFARPNLTAEINRLCLLAEPMPSLDNLSSQEGPAIATTQHLVGGLQNSLDSFCLLLISSFSQSDVVLLLLCIRKEFWNTFCSVGPVK
jgi:retinoblastoma-like protein 1